MEITDLYGDENRFDLQIACNPSLFEIILKASSHIYKNIPLGQRIPDTPHGVSVSLPTLRDVFAYEEKEPTTMAKISSGYPRFIRHPFIEALATHFLTRSRLDSKNIQPYFFASKQAVEDALKKIAPTPDTETEAREFCGVFVLCATKGSSQDKALANYVQHTGVGLSSREAEDLLIPFDDKLSPFKEKSLDDQASNLEPMLQQWFEPKVPSHILPCKSGMNAFYSAFETVNAIQSPKGRKDWISVGWLYLDTLQILGKYLPIGGKTAAFPNACDTESILEYIRCNGNQVAGLALEAPTNPLVQTPDLIRISDACKAAGIMTVMDPSLASPQNVDLSPFCDILCCSLTKYASHEGDVMIGAICIPNNSNQSSLIAEVITKILTPPYERDLRRLGASLHQADNVLEKINRSTMELAAFFNQHSGVSKLHWAYASPNIDHYRAIHRGEGRPGGVMTLELTKPIQTVYDALPLPKGPSFGTNFTLVCPYIHIAHYDLLQSSAGLQQLKQAGIHQNMIRISVGVEPVDELMAVFDRAL